MKRRTLQSVSAEESSLISKFLYDCSWPASSVPLHPLRLMLACKDGPNNLNAFSSIPRPCGWLDR